ncbi:YdcF family protein [Fictibacillus aquaticus]|uniref:DUF218 domain-containing protein n=1 Tax=Fictibacillus aquaticus TaxID=2021314 RepID=A0A235F871_9BACL|nr:YdcF family protein [Fictibacillus aquaticus]OYD57506.1 hypothetical protein CGZ90_12590 [Fictibacillus aquaticus]
MKRGLFLAGLAFIIYPVAVYVQSTNMDIGLAFFLVVGLFLIAVSHWFELSSRIYKKNRKLLITMAALAVAVVLMFEFFIFKNTVTDPGDLKEKADTILVLGAGTKNGRPGAVLKGRLDKALDYENNHPEVTFIVSGGKGIGKDVSEGEIMKNYLVEKGVSADRITIEDKATSTNENILYASKLMKKGSNLLIVTSDFHLFRAKMIAKELGVQVQGLGAPLHIRHVPQAHIREYFAIVHTLWSFI